MKISEIINILGQSLSDLTHKPYLACKGLIKIAFNDDGLQGKLNYNQVNYNDTVFVLKNALRRRLEIISIEYVDDTIDSLIETITKSQSIFTMSR